MGFFKDLKKYVKAPAKFVKSSADDPGEYFKKGLNDPLAVAQETFTGKKGDVLPIVPTDPLDEPNVDDYEDILGDKDALALPDAESLALKARRKGRLTQRERNMLTKRKSAFLPKRNVAKVAPKKAPKKTTSKQSTTPISRGAWWETSQDKAAGAEAISRALAYGTPIPKQSVTKMKKGKVSNLVATSADVAQAREAASRNKNKTTKRKTGYYKSPGQVF